MTARTLRQEFEVGVVQDGEHHRQNVTLTWTSDVPMEFRMHMWTSIGNGEGATVIWSIARDLLAAVTEDAAINTGGRLGMGDIVAKRVRFKGHPSTEGNEPDWIYIHLTSPDGVASLTFNTSPLAQLVRSSLAMVPRESEAIDVDGVISQIFQHTEGAGQ